MQLLFPEEAVRDLISSLEADNCSIPASESARLSTITPLAARNACNKGIELRQKGDLAGANDAFVEMLHRQDSINPTSLWAWARVLLLAKDFKHAQLLMHAEFANDYRGVQLFNPFIWMNVRLNLPGFEVNWLYDGSVPNYEVYGVNWFDDPKQICERISSLGNDGGYWETNYTWTPDDYAEFIRYFSPLSYLAFDGMPYAWTDDDQEETRAFYDDIYARMIDDCEKSSNNETQVQERRSSDDHLGHLNERGMPVLPMPDRVICDMIDKLESDSCEYPEADNYWYVFSPTSSEMVQALQMVKDGKLEEAHAWFADTFEQLTVIVPVFFGFWSLVCMLAKDFGHAQLLMQLRETNSLRGEQWHAFDSSSAIDRFLSPKPRKMDAQQYEAYLLENRVDLSDRSAVEEAIARRGENDAYWMTRYKLTDDEFKEFHRYFGEYSTNYKREYENKKSD